MNQNDPENDGVSSYEEFRNRIKRYFSNREITQADVDILNVKNQLKITEKQLCTEEIFYWLTKSEVLFSYEILEFFEQQNIHIDQLPWTPSRLRLGVSRESIFEKDIRDLLVGGNTAAVDWKWYDSKDYYDPDFSIYNDITIQYFDQNLAFSYEIWNYPEEQFPPVYAHSTIYDKNTDKVYITGGLGSGDRQRKNITEIYALDLETMDIQKVDALGVSPTCLYHHQAEMYDHDLIEMKGGYIIKNGVAIKNIYAWYFDLKTNRWLKQEAEKYHHWVLRPENGARFLFRDYVTLLNFEKNAPEQLEGYLQNLRNNHLYVADYKVYSQLYKPVEEMECNRVDDWIHYTYQCVLDDQAYQCCEDHNRLEVVFQASTTEEFQHFILDDLKSKLKQISGYEVFSEKVG